MEITFNYQWKDSDGLSVSKMLFLILDPHAF